MRSHQLHQSGSAPGYYMVLYGMVTYAMVSHYMVWHDMVLYGMESLLVWYGYWNAMVCYSMVPYDMVRGRYGNNGNMVLYSMELHPWYGTYFICL
jgi:hypothetical protein